MMRVYQISLDAFHDEINRLGWDGAVKQFPAVKAYLECSFKGSEGWKPEYFQYFKRTATIDTDDLDMAFQFGNIGPQSKVDGMLDHSVSVGDLLMDDEGQYHMVNSMGFGQILAV